MKQPLLILLFLIQTFSVGNGFSQNLTNEGTDFWLAFTKTKNGAGTVTWPAMYRVCITSKLGATGTVSIPGTGFSSGYTVAAGQFDTIVIPGADAANLTSEVIQSQGIHITSSSPVSAYAYSYHLDRYEASLVLPNSSLGSEYMISTYKNSYAPLFQGESEFVIVAAGAPCTVEIITTSDTQGGNLAGVPWVVTLASGEIYQVSANTAGGNDLTGSTVKATNGTDKFAVYSGHVFCAIGATNYKDWLYEVEYPINTWGKEYVAIPTIGQDYNLYRVMARENGTTIYVDGTSKGVFNAGQFYEDTLYATTYITGSEPIIVSQFMTSGLASAAGDGDPSLGLLNSNRQMLLDSVLFMADTTAYRPVDDPLQNFVSIVTRSVDTSITHLNGIALTNWQILPQNTLYSYLSKEVYHGANYLTTTGCGFLAYSYSLCYAGSHFYSAGTNLDIINDSITLSNLTTGLNTYCNDDSVNFQTSATGNVLNYLWDFGDATTSTQPAPTHAYSTATTYPVSVILTYNCFSDTLLDTVEVINCCISSSIPNTLANDSICPADSIFLQGAYQDTAGVYYDTLTTTSGCDSIVETTLAISAGAVANFVNPPDTICLSTGIVFNTSHPYNVFPDVDYWFDWGDGTSTGPISTPYNLFGPHYYSTAGTYIVQLIANNPSGTCPPDTAYHTLVVTPGPTAIISTASSTPCFGVTTDLIDASIPNGSPIVSWQWIINEIDTLTTQNPSYTFGFAGDQYIELTVIDANGCSATLTDTVEIHGNPNLVDFTFSSPLCLCSQVDFTASGTATTLMWDYGDANSGSGSASTNNYSYPGSYSVVLTGTDASGCTYSRSHVVDVCPNDTLYENSRSNNNWFFGRDQGIDFSTGSPVNQLGGQITGLSIEGSSTMSHHRTGDLLFYSDAKSVWDVNHNIMPNGAGFISSSSGQSTAQATLIVPMPGDSNQYYIFMNNGRSQDISLNETRFSVVDMNLNGGSGDIVTASKNTWMLTHSGGEAMSGTTKERATCSAEAEYWVAVADSNKIFLFLVDSGGVSLFSTTIIDPSGITPGFKKVHTSAFSKSGGKYIVKVNSVFGTEYHYSYVFDFNRITGVFSNPFRLTTQGTYASAFSPDETILYVSSHHPTTPAGIYQYDLNAASISASKIQLGTTEASSMWTGDDGKIYHVSPVVGTPYLGAINNPDVVGLGCNYVDDQVALTGSIASHNLQNIIKLELPLIMDSMEVAFTADTTSCLEVSFGNLTDTVLYDTCSFFTQGGGATYLWEFGDGTTSTAFEPLHTYANGGVFDVQLIVELPSMCLIDSITIPITVYPCASILVSDTSMCEGDSVLLVASGSASGYTWADSLAIGMALLTPDSSYLVSPTITTTYAVYNGTDTAYATVTVYNSGSVTNILSECAGFTTTVNGNVYSSTGVYVDTLFGANAEGCDSIITTDLTILATPIVTLTGDTTICIGASSDLISTNGAVIWNTGDTSATISVSPVISGWYSATLSNSCGSSTDSIYVVVNALPVAIAGNDTIVMPLDDFILNASGGVFYSWSPTTGLSCVDCPSPTATIEANTVYCVLVEDSNGCRSNDCVSITIDASGEVWAPNIFSPNGDALNDVFYIRGPIQTDDFVLMIFNRWGEKVFETSDPAQGWDGTQNDKALNTAVFVYTASGTTWGGTEFTLHGNITRFAK